jgi:hypothetical protein
MRQSGGEACNGIKRIAPSDGNVPTVIEDGNMSVIIPNGTMSGSLGAVYHIPRLHNK